MNVFVERDLIENGETIEDHVSTDVPIDIYNVQSASLLMVMFVSFFVVLCVVGKLWTRAGYSSVKQE